MSTKLPDDMLFVQIPNLMFNINLAQGIEYRSSSSVLMVIFKSGHYHTRKTGIDDFIEIKKQFLKLVEQSEILCIQDYVVFADIIFTVKKLAAIEYSGPSHGLTHVIRFKDGQYLTPHLVEDDFRTLYKMTQDAITSNAIAVNEGI